MTNKQIIKKIVKLIHADLRDRRGLRQEMEGIDDDTMKEMVETHEKIVAEHVQGIQPEMDT